MNHRNRWLFSAVLTVLLAGPLGQPSVRAYEYVKSNPINRTDPTGLFSFGELVTNVGIRAHMAATAFAGAHPSAVAFAGGLLAAANLYAFAQYQEVQAIVLSQPNPMGFLAGEAAALRVAVRDALSASGSIRGLTRAGERSRALAVQAGQFVQAEAATQTVHRIQISRARLDEAAKHIADAQAAGHPRVLTIDRAGANARRRAATGGYLRSSEFDLDEYPPAVFKEGGAAQASGLLISATIEPPEPFCATKYMGSQTVLR